MPPKKSLLGTTANSKPPVKRGRPAKNAQKGGSILGDIIPFGNLLGLGKNEKSSMEGKGILDQMLPFMSLLGMGNPHGGSLAGIPDILKSPEYLTTAMLATSPLAPLTPIIGSYLMGRKLFGHGILNKTALNQISKHTGVHPDDIVMGYHLLKELREQMEELKEKYKQYIKPHLQNVMPAIAAAPVQAPIPAVPNLVPLASSQPPQAYPRNSLGMGKKKKGGSILGDIIPFGNLLGLGKKKNAKAAKPAPKRSRKAKGGDIMGDLNNSGILKPVMSGFTDALDFLSEI